MWQCCPICRQEVLFNKQFPYYLCASCTSLLTDRKGQSVLFSFAQNPSGFKGFYKNNPANNYLYDVCYIGKEEFRVYSDGKNSCYIQPVDFLKYATRPRNFQNIPEDPSIPRQPEQIQNYNYSRVKFNQFVFSISPLLIGFFLYLLSENRLISVYQAILFFLIISIFIFFRFYFRKTIIFSLSISNLRQFPKDVLLFLFFFLLGIFILII